MEETETYKALTVHEFHSFVMRQFNVGILDERTKNFRLEQYHTFVNAEGNIYIHISEFEKLEMYENKS